VRLVHLISWEYDRNPIVLPSYLATPEDELLVHAPLPPIKMMEIHTMHVEVRHVITSVHCHKIPGVILLDCHTRKTDESVSDEMMPTANHVAKAVQLAV